MFIQLLLSKQGYKTLRQRSSYSQDDENQLNNVGHNSELINAKEYDYDTNQSTPNQKSQQQSLSGKQRVRSYCFRSSQRNDHHRHILAHEDGGLTCDDPNQIDKLRSVGKEMIKLIGRKILSGQFDLTKISIPIKSCYPKTALYNSVKGCSIFPYFMTSAAQCVDPLQRFKITLSCLIAQPYYLNMFLKPLNPVLGQTLQACLPDGTKVCVQQISHHPPISYFLIVGPEGSYRFSGYYDVEVNPGLNSLTIRNKGKRKFEFRDGTEIQTSYSTNQFSGTFFGTSRVQDTSNFIVEDKKNAIKCQIDFGKVKKKPSDYFASKILQMEKPVSHVEGTCLGYLNIDNKRYWDGRDLYAFDLTFQKPQERLPSDWADRQDLMALERGDLQIGQKLKEQLEQNQRADAKLRKSNRKSLN